VSDHVDILGAEYAIVIRSEADDKKLEYCDGYCDWTVKLIAVKKQEREDDSLHDLALMEKQVLRHEIVHAFLLESGLGHNTIYGGAWAVNEELVDWIALQGPKIYAAWQEAGAL